MRVPEDEEKSDGVAKKGGIGCGALVVIIVVGTFLVGAITNGSGGDNRPVESPSAKVAESPQTVASETAAPSSDPITEPSPSLVVDPASAAYRAQISSQAKELEDSFSRMSILTNDPKILDNNWRASLIMELAIWKVTLTNAQRLAVPDGYTNFHAKYLDALSKFDGAADTIASGTDNFDADQTLDGIYMVKEGRELLQEALNILPPA